MKLPLKSLTHRPPVIIFGLLVVAVLAFAGVGRLVHRFREQEEALARHLYQRGVKAQSEGHAEEALGAFRAALSYSRDNFQYQLSLARALRDTGRTAESETYLIRLWERTPQEGAVNLALGRLFVRQRVFDKAVQYYHYAIYGVWPSEAQSKRRDAQFELIEFLLQQNAYPQAQAELITMSSGLPSDPGLRLRVADLFMRAKDSDRALAQYQQILLSDIHNQGALLGAGQASFQLGRFRTSQGYLQAAVRADPENVVVHRLLTTAAQVLDSDPFAPRISDAERNRRVLAAFVQAGSRLDTCAQSGGIDLSRQSSSDGLPHLKARWLEMKPELAKLSGPHSALRDQQLPDELMSLVYSIEQQTELICGSAEGPDQALLLLAQNHAGVEQ
jgi:tetratricopeptide (TPR) repeat protein